MVVGVFAFPNQRAASGGTLDSLRAARG